jgi:flagellar basal-body rod protein FlgC
MGLFDAIGIAGTGLTVHRKWLDALSDNIANVNDVTSTSGSAFQERYVVAQEMSGGGVQVAGIELGSAQGRVVQDPTNPLADAQGYVRTPDIDLTSQMTELILAQRGYQANAAVVDRAKESYEAALQIGRTS